MVGRGKTGYTKSDKRICEILQEKFVEIMIDSYEIPVGLIFSLSTFLN
jgi:hypothetical protein